MSCQHISLLISFNLFNRRLFTHNVTNICHILPVSRPSSSHLRVLSYHPNSEIMVLSLRIIIGSGTFACNPWHTHLTLHLIQSHTFHTLHLYLIHTFLAFIALRRTLPTRNFIHISFILLLRSLRFAEYCQ